MNQPCFSDSSAAVKESELFEREKQQLPFFTIPVPLAAAGVSTTLAPRALKILRRSTEKLSVMVTTSG
jgi:hypothetical protein